MLYSRTHVEKSAVTLRGGVVSTQHPLASEAGAAILQAGGNAVDAAVAAAIAVTVVEPMMSGIGGGGSMMVHDPATGRDTAVEFLPRVPGAATPDMFELDPDRAGVGMYAWPAIKDDANFVGHRSIGTPGSIAGLFRSHARWGKLPWAEVLAPAIAYADGHDMSGYITALTAGMAPRIRAFPELARIFLPGGLPPAFTVRTYMPVDQFRQPDLAATLRRIAAEGEDDFYRGETARLIVADMERHGGLISAEDLANYAPIFHEETRKSDYRGYTISSLPVPCGVNTMVETLNMLEQFDVAGLGRDTPAGLTLMAQAQALSFQDRFAYLGDPEHHQIPEEVLLSKAYGAERARLIDIERFLDATPGDPEGFAAETGATPPDRSCTTHLGVVDKDGMMVSLTNTIGDLWGSFVVPEGTGMVMNDGMVWFDPQPGRINSIAPNKLPLSALCNVLIHKDGKPVVTVGAPGARKVMSSILQTTVNVIDHGMSLQEAIATPRIHCEKDTVLADTRLPEESLQALEAMGYKVQRIEESLLSSNFARPVGAQVNADGTVSSGVDALRPATAIGVPA